MISVEPCHVLNLQHSLLETSEEFSIKLVSNIKVQHLRAGRLKSSKNLRYCARQKWDVQQTVQLWRLSPLSQMKDRVIIIWQILFWISPIMKNWHKSKILCSLLCSSRGFAGGSFGLNYRARARAMTVMKYEAPSLPWDIATSTWESACRGAYARRRLPRPLGVFITTQHSLIRENELGVSQVKLSSVLCAAQGL